MYGGERPKHRPALLAESLAPYSLKEFDPMDSSDLFSHPIVHEAVHKSDSSTDAVAAPVFSDSDQSTSKQHHQ